MPETINIVPVYPTAAAEGGLSLNDWKGTPTLAMVGEGTSLQLAVLLAVLAAKDKRPDALARGDETAKLLAKQDVWSVTTHAAYLGKPPEARLAWWASGEALQLDLSESEGWHGPVGGGVLDQWLINGVKSLYQSLYGGAPDTSWMSQIGAQGAEVAQEVATAPQGGGAGAWIAGGLVVLGLGGAAAYAATRMKAPKDKVRTKKKGRR